MANKRAMDNQVGYIAWPRTESIVACALYSIECSVRMTNAGTIAQDNEKRRSLSNYLQYLSFLLS